MAGDANDYKIDGNINLSGSANEFRVGAQPTVLKGSPADNKQVFDNYCDMIATKHNGLCEYLHSERSTVVDQEVITLYESLGWIPENPS